jgi:hypothetical protein
MTKKTKTKKIQSGEAGPNFVEKHFERIVIIDYLGMLKYFLLYCIIAGSVMFLFTMDGMKISSDSKYYLKAAEYFKHGEFKEGIENVLPTHPPFYSMVLGGLQRILGGDLTGEEFRQFTATDFCGSLFFEALKGNVEWARLLAILSFGILAVGVFVLANEVIGKAGAHLSTILVIGFHPILDTFSWVWTETLYVPLTLLSLLLILFYQKKQNLYFLIFSGILAGLAFFTRFIGISLLLAGAGLVFYTIEPEADRRRSFHLVVSVSRTILWSIFAFSPVFVYWGFDQGFRPPPAENFFYYFFRSIHVLWIDFGIVGLFLLSLAFVFRIKIWKGILWYIASYMILLLIMNSLKNVGGIGTRLICPIYPFLLIYIAAVVVKISQGLACLKRK